MNEDESETGQQGYGSDQDPTQQQASQNGQSTDGETSGNAGAASTGQASYGNSGEADLLSQGQQGQAQSQNSPSFGQDNDLGDAAGNSPAGSSGFIGSGTSGNDMGASSSSNSASAQHEGMPLGTAGGGYGGSSETSGSSGSQAINKTDDASGRDPSASGFADQGQGAPKEDTKDGETSGITDIEIERSQGRETDIEGSAL